MNIYTSSQIKDNKIRYEIRGKGTSARTFRTWDNQVLKVFLNNDVYERILKTHGGNFLSYLEELSKVDNPSLLVTNDVYVTKNGIVTAYKYPYLKARTLFNIKRSVDLDAFMDALEIFYENIKREENFALRDTHGRNIMYMKDELKKIKLVLIDLDLCKFTDKDERKQNIKNLDNTIFKSLLYIPRELDPYITDEKVKPMYESLHHEEINVLEFLREYREYIEENFGECKTVDDLNRGLIVPENPSFYK